MNAPTKEEVIAVAGIHPLKVKNIYLFGSRVYGTATENSDYDYILVGSALLAKNEIKTERINVHIHTTDVFKDELFKHDMHNLECFFAPDYAKLMVKEPFANFKVDVAKLVKSALTESTNSWHGAKLKIKDENIYYGLKSLWHSIRMLDVAIQIAENGKIVDFSSMNYLWVSLSDSHQTQWEYFKAKYLPLKISFENKLKGLNV